MRLGNLEVRNTRDLINENTRWLLMIYGLAKFGKTTLAAGLDAITKKYLGKPTLFIAVEAGDGGGTMSIQDYGVDFVRPTSLSDLEQVLGGLATDTHFGGVVLDSCTDYVHRFVKPYALKLPCREKKGAPVAAREAGVPTQSDYQSMGEKCRQHLNQIAALTEHPDVNIRKHVIVTALERTKTDRETQETTFIGPDLPGAMSECAAAIFQTIGYIGIRTRVEKDETGRPTRVTERKFITKPEGVRIAGDRMNVFPPEAPASLLDVYEKFWLPKVEENRVRGAG